MFTSLNINVWTLNVHRKEWASGPAAVHSKPKIIKRCWLVHYWALSTVRSNSVCTQNVFCVFITRIAASTYLQCLSPATDTFFIIMPCAATHPLHRDVEFINELTIRDTSSRTTRTATNLCVYIVDVVAGFSFALRFLWRCSMCAKAARMVKLVLPLSIYHYIINTLGDVRKQFYNRR